VITMGRISNTFSPPPTQRGTTRGCFSSVLTSLGYWTDKNY
jgi:hypothetical protein